MSPKFVIIPILDKNTGFNSEARIVFDGKEVYFLDKEKGKEYLKKQYNKEADFNKAFDAGIIGLKIINDPDSVEYIISRGELYD